jgi:pantoate--beta-alanine ligase
MNIHQHITTLREALIRPKRTVFVPTMGFLHAGHLALIQLAKKHGERVVASIFVNPLQFAAHEDLSNYPRNFSGDCELLAQAGVDELFAPREEEMYPHAQSYWIEPRATEGSILEAQHRPGHFSGVCTVVLKLLNIVRPEVLILGKKDYQQLVVLRQMITALNVPLDILAAETVRDPDGLALSSRNVYLDAQQRHEAPRLYQVLQGIKSALKQGDQRYSHWENWAYQELQAHGWEPDYVAVRKRSSLESPALSGDLLFTEPLVVLAAARLGHTRLIDNLEI